MSEPRLEAQIWQCQTHSHTFAYLQVIIIPSVATSTPDQPQNCFFGQATHHQCICKTHPSRTGMFTHLHTYNTLSKFEPMLQQFICTKSYLQINSQRLGIHVLILDFPYFSHFSRHGSALLRESRDQRKRYNV